MTNPGWEDDDILLTDTMDDLKGDGSLECHEVHRNKEKQEIHSQLNSNANHHEKESSIPLEPSATQDYINYQSKTQELERFT